MLEIDDEILPKSKYHRRQSFCGVSFEDPWRCIVPENHLPV